MATDQNYDDIEIKRFQALLPGLLIFERVARYMNFAKAAQELGVTPTAVSKSIKQLEEQMTVRLFNRNTRSVALTEAGARLLESLGPSLDQIRSSLDIVTQKSDKPSGHLRINAAQISYAILLEPYLKNFLNKYPQVTIEFSLDNKLVDIISSGFDAGIRLGESLQKDMIATPIGPMQYAVAVASPKYIKKHGRPSHPKDLLTHNCIRQRFTSGGAMFEWEFKVNGKDLKIDVQGNIIVDDMAAALRQASAGNGIAYTIRQFAQKEIETGQLEVICEKFAPQLGLFHLYYPSRRLMPARLRVFIDYLKAENWIVPS